MTAVIYIDPQTIQPVIDGEWHRPANLQNIPQPGEEITVLCGARATVAFEPRLQSRAHGIATMCYDCDQLYRRALGIPAQHGVRR